MESNRVFPVFSAFNAEANDSLLKREKAIKFKTINGNDCDIYIKISF